MQVENIECQIAQAQIGNFLAGSGLSEEAVRQLEEHIAACANCKAVLTERRDALKAMLSGKQAVVDFEEIAREAEATKAKSIAMALRKKSLEQMLQPKPEVVDEPAPIASNAPATEAAEPVEVTSAIEEAPRPKTKNSWKPLAYSCALASVLVGMSLFAGNMDKILGPRANTPTTPVTQPVDPVAGTQSTSAPATLTSATTENSRPDAASVESAAETEALEVEALSSAVGGTVGLLATTQFKAESDAIPIEPAPTAVTQQAPAPTVSAPKKVVNRPRQKRVIRRKPTRRASTTKPTAKSSGIRVYNP